MTTTDERTPDQLAAAAELVRLLAGVEHDAARYRWLRGHSNRRVYDAYSGAALDIAIDIDIDVCERTPDQPNAGQDAP